MSQVRTWRLCDLVLDYIPRRRAISCASQSGLVDYHVSCGTLSGCFKIETEFEISIVLLSESQYVRRAGSPESYSDGPSHHKSIQKYEKTPRTGILSLNTQVV
jgi:hypothetical protein